MGAAWAFILFFVFWGPEMSQDEREEEAALARHYEEMRSQGLSLEEIGAKGAKRAKGLEGEQPDLNELAQLKAADTAKHVERVRDNVVGV
jgi:SHS family lactate transporter-like MFS transporter